MLNQQTIEKLYTLRLRGMADGNLTVRVVEEGLHSGGYGGVVPDGFRILVRDSPVSQTTGTFASLIVDVAAQVEHLLADEFATHKLDKKLAGMYSQMLVGMVALTGQWWLDVRKPKKEEVVAHLVNLAWNGLVGMESKPRLITVSK